MRCIGSDITFLDAVHAVSFGPTSFQIFWFVAGRQIIFKAHAELHASELRLFVRFLTGKKMYRISFFVPVLLTGILMISGTRVTWQDRNLRNSYTRIYPPYPFHLLKKKKKNIRKA